MIKYVKASSVEILSDKRKAQLFDIIIHRIINECNPDPKELRKRLAVYGITDQEMGYIVNNFDNAYYVRQV